MCSWMEIGLSLEFIYLKLYNMEQKEEYNVIWIDDEWDSIGKSFIQICEKRHNIHIKAFKTRREGMEALEQNLKF